MPDSSLTDNNKQSNPIADGIRSNIRDKHMIAHGPSFYEYEILRSKSISGMHPLVAKGILKALDEGMLNRESMLKLVDLKISGRLSATVELSKFKD